MATLLVAMSIAAIMMTRVMPMWKTISTREKEAELVFRGMQYQRAIGLFQRRAGPGVLPPSIDLLVEQKFLRKKYKDPITNDDFEVLRQGQAIPGVNTPGLVAEQPQSGRGAPGTSGRQGGGAQTSQGSPGPSSSATRGSGGPPISQGRVNSEPFGAAGGIIGVVSKSNAQSFRLFNGRNHYNEWQFIYQELQRGPSGPGADTPGGPPGRGGRGMQPGPQGDGRRGNPDNPFNRGGPGGGRGERGNQPRPFGGRGAFPPGR